MEHIITGEDGIERGYMSGKVVDGVYQPGLQLHKYDLRKTLIEMDKKATWMSSERYLTNVSEDDRI